MTHFRLNMIIHFIALILSAMTVQMAQASPLPAPKPILKIVPNHNDRNNHSRANSDNALSVLPIPPHHNDAPLQGKDITLYTEIIALQDQAQWGRADRLFRQIDNTILQGHLLARLYLDSDYPVTRGELQRWMQLYADHPQSKQIDLMLQTRWSRYDRRLRGTLDDLRYFPQGSRYISDRYRGAQRNTLHHVQKQVTQYLDRGAVSAALKYFEGHPVQNYIDIIDKAQILASIAAHYLYLNRIDKARTVALEALRASDQAPLAGWVAGLIAWMDDDMAEAARLFTIAAKARYASPWMTAAASYWGARAATRAGLTQDVAPLLAKAIANQRTFYGLIATKAMGFDFNFNWQMPEYTLKMQDVLLRSPIGARAVALAQVGLHELAEQELFNLDVKADPQLAQAALSLAHHYNLAAYAMRFASAIQRDETGFYDSALFPISSWTKNVTDQALVNAFIRQESRFIATAKNGSGATGLMQVMPGTAAFVTGDARYHGSKAQNFLSHPQTNVQIGADYLNHLLELEAVNGDLFGLAIAYNAGPGKLRRWKRDIQVDDPLLFIELLPASETRAFVERVATNYWIYQMKMGQDPKTLFDVASAQWPVLYSDLSK